MTASLGVARSAILGGFLPIFGGRFVDRACNDTLEMEL